MNANVSKCSLRTPQTVCNTFEERAVDMDVVLPDYVPEISAVLKCSLRPYVTSRSQSGDRYVVDGVSEVRVLYVTEDRKTIHCYTACQPFHVSFTCDKAIHNMVRIKTDYVHCRALAPRRLDVHGAFRVFLNAIGESSVAVYSPPAQSDVFCRTKDICVMLPICETEKCFVLEEYVDVGNVMDRFSFAEVTIVSTEVKSLVNKIIVKGTARVKAVGTQGNTHHTWIHEIPFSQIVDVEGVCDRWRCNADVQIGECDIHLQTAENGTLSLVLRAKLSACVRCYETVEETVVTDAYSVRAPLLCELTPLNYLPDKELVTASQTVSTQIDLPESVCDLVQLWAELKSFEQIGKTFNMCVSLSMIAANTEGELAYYERTVDVSGACTSEGALSLRLIGVEGAVSGHNLRIQLETAWCDECFETVSESVVCNAVAEERNPYVKSNATIRIVYAEAGDSLWEIAKTHHACMQDVMEENDLSDSVIHVPTMLMIPMM